jgi:hypothetical protein
MVVVMLLQKKATFKLFVGLNICLSLQRSSRVFFSYYFYAKKKPKNESQVIKKSP